MYVYIFCILYQAADHCFCGIEFGIHGDNTNGGNDCTNGFVCSGDQNLRCGHGGTNDIFMTSNKRSSKYFEYATLICLQNIKGRNIISF